MSLLIDFPADMREDIVERSAKYLALAIAEQQQLSVVHKGIKGLATRLQCSEDTAAELLASQQIHYTSLGKKAYRITEADVREYLKSK